MGLDEDITNSRIVASYAFVQAIEAVQVLGDWLLELEGAVYDLDADLIEQLRQSDPAQYRLLVERKRRAQSDSEITARESFAQLLGAADKTLMIAALYEQAEIGLASERFDPGSFFPQALKTIFKKKSAEKGRAAGLANRRPDSAKQIEARERRRRICAEADRFLKLEPKITQSDLVSRLVAKGGLGSSVTIMKHLRAAGYLSEKKTR